MISQAALIAGTTIGGGFLTLPTATAPCGAAPAAVGLVAVWFFLLSGALSLSNAIFMLKRRHPNHDQYTVLQENLSLFSLVRECFGNTAGIAAGFMFLLLVKVTMVAQLSKIGVLLKASFPVLGRHVWTVIFSSAMGLLCTCGSKEEIERLNDVLTTTMLSSFAVLVLLAGGSGWSADGLRRADYNSLLPSKSSPWAIPIFIQLLIYNEVVPLVASRLQDEGKVRKAIVYGSLIPLAMCLAWSIVALGIVPYNPLYVGDGVIYDPLTKLGDLVLSKGGLVGKAFLASVNILAGSAICTTVIGSILASTQYFDDMIINMIGRSRQFDGKQNATVDQTISFMRNVTTHVLAIVPSTVIALLGSSQLYYHATSFAGEFPCTLLYGLVPPLCNIRLRWLHYGHERKIKTTSHIIAQMLLALISSGILLANAMT